MTIAQAFIVFGVLWWLLLLMALPIGVKIDATPKKGHASSAPNNPNIKRKCKWVTLVTLIITLTAYFLMAPSANAAKTYQTSSECEQIQPHTPAKDVAAQDGHGVHGKQVKPANTSQGSEINKQLEYIDIPLELPLENYVKTDKFNADLSNTNIRPGTLTLDRNDNSLHLNGVHVSQPPLYNTDCIRKKGDSVYSTQ
jgi:predicted secreted protein